MNGPYTYHLQHVGYLSVGEHKRIDWEFKHSTVISYFFKEKFEEIIQSNNIFYIWIVGIGMSVNLLHE